MQQLVRIDFNGLGNSLSTCAVFGSFYFIPFQILNFHCPVFKKSTEEGQTFSARTIRNWNDLSVDAKKVKNVKSFKKKLYTNLITKQKETENFEYLFK